LKITVFAPNVRIGYFSQELSILDENKSILGNVMAESVYDESFVRILLASLLFKGDSVYKKVLLLNLWNRGDVHCSRDDEPPEHGKDYSDYLRYKHRSQC